MVVDGGFVIQDVNRVFLEKNRLIKEDVLGKKCHEIMTESGPFCVYGTQPCPLEKARETGQRAEVTHFHEGEVSPKEMIRIMYPIEMEGGTS
ncbi:hypothetical protein ACFL2O_07410, partial [Thermodesulfobacteriota bacterium]